MSDETPNSNKLFQVQAQLARDERDAALRALAGRLAHQMRNPLAAIRAACSGLRSEIDDPEQQETLELTLIEIDRMLGFVSATLRATPLTSEAPQPVELRKEIAEIVDIVTADDGKRSVIQLRGEAALCSIPKSEFRLSLYSLLRDLTNAKSVSRIAIDLSRVDKHTQIKFDIVSMPDEPTLRAGLTSSPNLLQPVGLLVAERFARDMGGRLIRFSDVEGSHTFALILPCNRSERCSEQTD